MREMIWETPPDVRWANIDPDVAAFVSLLRERPGEWALYGEIPPSQKAALSRWTKQFPGTQWTRRQQADGPYKVWARAIPKGECPKCGRVFQNEANLPAHVETCKGSK